jgi:hypothetical protein
MHEILSNSGTIEQYREYGIRRAADNRAAKSTEELRHTYKTGALGNVYQ